MLNRIPGTIGCYASVDGKVFRSLKNGSLKEVKPYYGKNGYGLFKLKTANGRKPFYIHRCICSAFKPNDENRSEVNHIDGNKQNNHVGNLEWATKRENTAHATINNLYSKGFNHYKAKLNKEQVNYIRSSNISTYKLAKELGVSHTTVWQVRNYKTFRDTDV